MESNPSSSLENTPETSEGLAKNTETQEVFDPYAFPFKPHDTLVLDGIYEHYKSTPDNPKYYLVFGVTENTETGECFVLYQPLYETEEKLNSARPVRIFTEEVDDNETNKPRFHFVADIPQKSY